MVDMISYPSLLNLMKLKKTEVDHSYKTWTGYKDTAIEAEQLCKGQAKVWL